MPTCPALISNGRWEGARFERMMAGQGNEEATARLARWRALGNEMPKVLQQIVLEAYLPLP